MTSRPPPTPSGTFGSAPTSASQASSRRQPDVDSSNYRQRVLRPNGVDIRSKLQTLPDTVEDQVKKMRAQRESPGLSEEDALALCHAIEDAQNEGEGEGNVVSLFGPALLPTARGTTTQQSLKRNNMQPLLPQSLPSLTFSFISPPPKLKTPTPDILYGYDLSAFAKHSSHPKALVLQALDANPLSSPSRNCYYPFFAIEFKAQATGGTTYVATNQCAGGGSACVKALRQLQSSFETTTTTTTISRPTAFSAAIDVGQLLSTFIGLTTMT